MGVHAKSPLGHQRLGIGQPENPGGIGVATAAYLRTWLPTDGDLVSREPSAPAPLLPASQSPRGFRCRLISAYFTNVARAQPFERAGLQPPRRGASLFSRPGLSVSLEKAEPAFEASGGAEQLLTGFRARDEMETETASGEFAS